MRCLVVTLVLLLLCIPSGAQTTSSDKALLAKTRALYDAPFRRTLVSFDCAVQFDWTKHLLDSVGSVPPAAAPLVEKLQAISHRVTVRRTGAIVSATSKSPNHTQGADADELERVLNTMVESGLNAWTPFSTDVILPVEPTLYSFQKIEPGYKLAMEGAAVDATLLLDSEMRVTGGVSQLPQPMRFTTEFASGPDGFVLASVKTGTTADAKGNAEATFAYTYQTVQGFQLPLQVSVTAAAAPKVVWRYTLNDCTAFTGVVISNGPSKP
jgi:hypothetical protein